MRCHRLLFLWCRHVCTSEKQLTVRALQVSSPAIAAATAPIQRRTFLFASSSTSNNEMVVHTTQKQPTAPPQTFYRRPLPESCTSLSSSKGQSLFRSAMAAGGTKSFFHLMEQFTTQSEPAYCGPSTLVVILNALSVDPRRLWKGPWRWYDESMLNCCLDPELIKSTGITLNQFVCLAKCQGLTTQRYWGDESTVEEFRDAVRTACVDSESDHDRDEYVSDRAFLVASYSRRVLGQTGTGHFSPIGAYDAATDSVLILDTARFKYGPHWVPLPSLFDAFLPQDPDTGRSRGFVLLSYKPKEDKAASRSDSLGEGIGGSLRAMSSSLSGSSRPPPMSILFEATKRQNDELVQYKDFLESNKNRGDEKVGYKVSLDEVVRYWTRNGGAVNHVWSVVLPQLLPVTTAESERVDKVRKLMKAGLKSRADTSTMSYHTGDCGTETSVEDEHDRCDNCQRTIPMSTLEAVFVMYLASLQDSDRRLVVEEATSAVEAEEEGTADYTVAGEQLLAEADLLRLAMDVSPLLAESLQ